MGIGMPTKITDPDLLNKLNGGSAPEKVSDPKILSQLNSGLAEKADPVGRGRTAFDQSMQGATYGTADEIQNMMGALIAHHVTGEDYHSLLDQATANSQKRLKGEEDQHPTLSGASQLVGGIIGPGIGESKVLGKIAPGLSAKYKAGSNIAKGILGGSSGGAAYGAGSAQDGNRIAGAEKGAVIGGLAGGAGSGIGEGIAKIAAPKFDKAVQILQKHGVKLTPGQMSYKSAQIVKRAEDALGHIPVLGSKVKDRLIDSFHSFNTAVLNHSLAPLGKTLPSNTPMGRAAIKRTGRMISNEYDKLLPKLKFEADPLFMQERDTFLKTRVAGLPKDQQKEFNRIVKNATDKHVIPGHPMTGEDFKDIESDISHYQRKYAGSQDPTHQELAEAFDDYLDMGRNTLVRQNPTHAPKLSKINQSWAIFKQAQKASIQKSASGGLFSPHDLLIGMKNKNPAYFASGGNDLQKLADAGAEVLPKSIPSIEGGHGKSPIDLLIAPAAVATPALYSKAAFNAANAPAKHLAKRQAIRSAIQNGGSTGFGATLGTLSGGGSEPITISPRKGEHPGWKLDHPDWTSDQN